ncbi:MAG: hypothetical protein RLY71_873 [Pseudomonadota bacterium]
MLLQLRLASGYLAIFLMPTLLLVGMWTGHPSLAFSCVMLVFPMARAIFGAHQLAEPVFWSEGIATFLDRLPVAYGIALTSTFLLLADSLRNGAANSFSFAVFAGLSLWMTMLFATCPAHDLIHRRQAPDRAVGQIIAGLAGYPFLGFEHREHHTRWGDTARAEWPRIDDSVWQFAGRRIVRILRETIGPGGILWRFNDASSESLQLRLGVACSIGAWSLLALAGGWAGFFIYLATIVGVAFGVQVITYLQHWGLGDDNVSTARSRQFAWEDDCLFQSWITLHISFHQEHHRLSNLPYYRIGMANDSPRQPAGYVLLMLVCLVPRLWRKLMQPALDHWKKQPLDPKSPGRRLTCFSLYPGGG